jgi:hypothetical protein
MKLLSRNEAIGFLAAPLAAPIACLLAAVVYSCISGESYDKTRGVLEWIIHAFKILLGVSATVLPVTYAIEICIVVPIYLICKRLKLVNFWSVTIGGLFIGAAPAICYLYPEFVKAIVVHDIESLFFFGVFAFCGYSTAVTFWFISKEGRKNGT